MVITAHISQKLAVALKTKSEAPGALWNQWNVGQGKKWFLLCFMDKLMPQMREKTEDWKVFLTETFNISPDGFFKRCQLVNLQYGLLKRA